MNNAKSSLNDALVTSVAGKSAISADEGFSRHPYDDRAKHCTVGIGILLSKAPCTAKQKSTDYDPDILNKSFHSRLHDAERRVKHVVKETQLSQAQFDALVSFVYNVGSGGATRALTLANNGKLQEVANEMAVYVNVKSRDKKTGKVHHIKSAGLIKRRIRESEPFIQKPKTSAAK